MTNYKKQIVSVTAAAMLVLNLATPALAETSITISGNSDNTDNTAHVSQNNTTTVTQNNQANVTNNITSNSDTGNNNANHNTGGNVTVDTGNASTTANVTNNLNSNAANVDSCNCSGDTDVTISGNGDKSDNYVKVDNDNTTYVKQDNNANVKNNVKSNANTGGNDANHNTGGSVKVTTGDASSTTTVTTNANANVAQVGGGNGEGAKFSAMIMGNGDRSDSDIKAYLDNSVNVLQANSAHVYNNVDSNAKTGGNDAKHNTGGDVTIDTGNADIDVDVDNAVNFNAANVDCGCLLDGTAKIASNGDKSDNNIFVDLDGTNNVFQGGEGYGNNANLANKVNSGAKTGYNDADHNTSSDDPSDPEVTTGDSSTKVDVKNSGNTNVVGAPIDWPSMPEMDVTFSFNLSDLIAILGMHS